MAIDFQTSISALKLNKLQKLLCRFSQDQVMNLAVAI